MTCIIGIEFDNKVYLAGDKLGSGYHMGAKYRAPKVFVNGGAIFGYTSTYRWGQLLEFGLKDVIAPKDDDEVYHWMVANLVPSIHKVLKEADYDAKKAGGTALIGVNGKLWEIQDEGSVLNSENGYNAVGCGDELALGVLGYAMKHNPPQNVDEVKELLKEAMKVVGHHSVAVSQDCYIISK